MNTAIPDALVSEYASLIPSLASSFGTDAHVVAAALIGRADVIVTHNLRDFPSEELHPLGIEAQDPDEFLLHQLSLDPGRVHLAIAEQAEDLKNPPMARKDVLDSLAKHVPAFVQEIRTS